MRSRRITTHCLPSSSSGHPHAMGPLHVCNAPSKSLSLKGSQQQSRSISACLSTRASCVEIPIHVSFRKKLSLLVFRSAVGIVQLLLMSQEINGGRWFYVSRSSDTPWQEVRGGSS